MKTKGGKLSFFLLTLVLLMYISSCVSVKKNQSNRTQSNRQGSLLEEPLDEIPINEYEIEGLTITSTKQLDMDNLSIYNNHYFIEFENGTEKTDGMPLKNRLYVDMHYPQVYGIGNDEKEVKINSTLKMALFQIISDDYSKILRIYKSIMRWPKDKNEYEFMSAMGEYRILDFTDSLISLHIKNELSYGTGRTWWSDYNLTIDLHTGEIMKLLDIIHTDTILFEVESGKYEIFSGSTNEINNALRDTKVAFDKEISAALKKSIEECTMGNTLYKGPLNSSNFGIDKEFIYVRLSFEPALYGYLILKIPLVELGTDFQMS